MNIISTLWGVVALLLALVALFPLLGWANWFILAFAVIGLIIGAFGRRKTGMLLNSMAILIACFRLFLGGGIF